MSVELWNKVVKAAGGVSDPENTLETTLMRNVITACGGNCDNLPDNLKSTLLVAMANAVAPSAVEEETKTISPDFSGGDVVVTPSDGKLLSEVTVQKPETLVPENIALGVNIAGVVGTLEAGTSDDVRYVTFMNGETVLYVKPVAVGDDCVDVVSKGLIETPTKEADAQYTYTHYGWGASDGGAADSTILQNITEDKTVYAIYTSAVRYYTITYLDDDGVTVLKTETLAYGAMPSYEPVKEGYDFDGWTPAISSVTGDQTYTAIFTETIDLEGATWAAISAISAAGTGENYFAVGDTKSVYLKGTMGTKRLDTTLKVYILGFNHNSEVEGNGIHFGTFKTADGVDVCLEDGQYYTSITDGTKRFNTNHAGFSNNGGWAGCDLRYDILGSTNVRPSEYNVQKTTSCVGYDATSTCATNPVANTLMACLPAELRAVMKPITKWTNNVGGKVDTEEMVTASVDYLPLLSEFEIFGTHTYANSYEQNHQQQYAYFAAGNSARKNRHSDTDAAADWWTRSPAVDTSKVCVAGGSNGVTWSFANTYSLGVAPVFMV